jgi:hypothetical protein
MADAGARATADETASTQDAPRHHAFTGAWVFLAALELAGGA